MKPFEISRVVDAPRDRVWKAWTEVEHLKKWWGPKGFVVTHLTNDLRPGGRMHYCLRMPNGEEMWGKFQYGEIKKPERLVWINSFSDKDGGTTVHPMNASWPREMHTTVIFEEQGPQKTRISVRWLPVEGSSESELKTFNEGRKSMNQGWSGTFEQFDQFLAKGA